MYSFPILLGEVSCMNISMIKLFAALFMVLDHVSVAFGSRGWVFFSGTIDSIFRCVGRISFPIFVFALVNGWNYTKDKEKYFNKLIVFAIISEVPYSLALSIVNTMPVTSGEELFIVDLTYKTGYLLFLVVIFLFNCYLMKKVSYHLKLRDMLLFCLFLVNVLMVKVFGIWLLTDSLNVLNTFLCGLFIISHYEAIKNKRVDVEFIISVINSILFMSISLWNADYGTYFMGVILIILLYFTYDKKFLSCVGVIFWAFVFYGILFSNLRNFLFSSLAILLIVLYDKEKIPCFKNVFYFLYPFHLLLIGIINIFIRLNS